MSSDHPFDQKLKRSFDGYEPDVQPNWQAFQSELAGGSGLSPAGSSPNVNRWAMAAAVAAGGVGMWFVQPLLTEDEAQDNMIVESAMNHEANLLEEGVAQRKSLLDDTREFVSDFLDLEAEMSLQKASNQAQLAKPSQGLSGVFQEVQPANAAIPKPANNESPLEESANNGMGNSMEALLAELPFNASVREACEGVEVSFELSGLDRSMSFLWNFGDGHFSSDPAPNHVFDRPGTYDITLSVRSPGNGFIRTRTIQNMITVLPKPEAAFSWAMPEMVSGNKVRVMLQNETEDASSSQWVVDGESSTNGLVQLDVPGVYPVHLIASNSHGCLDDAKNEVVVGNRHGILAQSRFSPNGDGLYDEFMPKGLEDMTGQWVLVISDKSGQEVFRTSDFDQPWEGQLPNGALAENRSVYQWTVRCISPEGVTRIFTDRLRVER
jgi:PKD repeat protein